VGVGVAFFQIRRRIGGYRGIWLIPRVWVLLIAFMLIPVFLFWILDRTAVIHDSSLLAALLVAFTYERILSNSSPDLKASETVSAFWQPFVKWTELIARKANEIEYRNALRLAQRVVEIAIGDQAKFAILRNLALIDASDPDALNKQLQELEKREPLLGKEGVTRQQAQVLYQCVALHKDANYRLRKQNFFTLRMYFWNVIDGRSSVVLVGGIIAVLIVAIVSIGLTANSSMLRPWYYSWRLQKANTTEVDQSRSQARLENLLTIKECKANTYKYVKATLLRPDLPAGRAEILLKVVLSARHTDPEAKATIPALLIAALNTSNVDTRDRIQHALIYYALESKIIDEKDPVWMDLKQWTPTADKSPLMVEKRIDQWNVIWNGKSKTPNEASPPNALAQPDNT
jgi:hypothetical protein